MRVQGIRGVFVGAIACLLPALAAAQNPPPVRIVPVTPAGQPMQTSPAPAPSAVVNTAPTTPTVPPMVMTQQPIAQPSSPARKLELSFSQGTVNLVAENVTVSDILAEWTKRGGTTFVNGEKVTGSTVNLQFQGETETHVIEALLRSVAGYIVAPRGPQSVGASSVLVVHITPTSKGSTAPFAGAPPQFSPMTTPDDEISPVVPIGAPLPNRPPQGMQPPGGAQVPGPSPNMGQTSATPGVIIPPVVPGQVIKPPTTPPIIR